MRELSSPTPPQPRTPDEPESTRALFEERIALAGGGLRRRTARGSLVNAAYFVGLHSLGLLKGFVVAAFLTRAEYGVWGILLITVATLLWLRQIGISDKYIQQSEDDQELAFQRAFTLQLLLAGAFGILLLGAMPLFALVYGRSELLLPGIVLALATVAGAFTSPAWIFYRRMQFVRQRTLQAIDPVTSFVVTVALAIAGAGYWSLVIGTAAGTAVAAVAAVWASPYPLALRYDRGTLRRYAGFSWPLFVSGGSAIVIAQGSILLGEWQLGLAGVGAISLAAVIAQYTDRVDTIITGTLYPAICAVRDRKDLLFESFVKSNRLALMWGMPFGLALTLFASDLVEFGIGEQWRPTVVLLQVFGVNAAVNHVGFNWTAFYRAIGDTRPVAVVSFVTMLGFLAAPRRCLSRTGSTASRSGWRS